jgi:hypothetical protein
MHRRKVLQGHLQGRLENTESGIADHKIDPIKFLFEFHEGLFDTAGVTHIRLHREGRRPIPRMRLTDASASS